MKLTVNRNRLLNLYRHLPCKRALLGTLNRLRRLQLLRLQTPENLIYFVTSRCNARCAHCFYWRQLNQPGPEMDIAQIEIWIKSLRNRIDTLALTGGEPLLREDLPKIIGLFYRLNRTRKIHLTTNGSFPDRLYDLCHTVLQNMNVELSVQISIDGDEKQHNALRGGDFYRRAVESLQRLKQLSCRHRNFLVAANTVVTRDNINSLDALSSTMRDLGIDWGVSLLRGTTYGILSLDKTHIAQYDPRASALALPSLDDLRALQHRLTSDRRDLGHILQGCVLDYSMLILQGRRSPVKCQAGKVDGVVYANGDVALCEVTNSFGNLQDYAYDFYSLWTSEKARQARAWIRSCSCIHPCHMINAMKYDYRFLLPPVDHPA